MLGGAIARHLATIHGDDAVVRPRAAELDLRDGERVRAFVDDNPVDAVVHAAAKVGGIQDRIDHPTSYLLENLQIDTSLLAACVDAGIPNVLYISSAAIYPAAASQPIGESALLTGTLEGPLESYAIAKIAGTRFCQYASEEFGLNYRVAVPSNMYGPGEHLEPGRSHLAASALLKCHAAKTAGETSVEVWGDGTARRELTYVDDVSAWLASQLTNLDGWPALVNVGRGSDNTVREIYEQAAITTGFDGDLVFDATKPVGVAQRLLDSARAQSLGWSPTTDLADGMARAYAAMYP